MEDLNPLFNVPLSLIVGGLLGLWFAVKTKRPRKLWSTIAVGVLMILSPNILVSTRLFWDGFYGFLGNYLIMGFTTVVMIMAGVRFLRSRQNPQPSAQQP